MLNIRNERLFGEVVDQALAKNAGERQSADLCDRWRTAILKAANLLATGDLSFIHFDRENGEMLMLSRDKVYASHGTCQCESFVEHRQPCYHRAMARLLVRYYEQEAMVTAGQTQAVDFVMTSVFGGAK